MGTIPGPGETAIARYISAWLQHRGLESHWIEPTKGRPSIVGVSYDTGGAKSLMLNGHIGTVTLMGYEGDPLSGKIEDGRLYGRGAADIKCGIAAAMIALADSAKLGLCGDVILTPVADEEDLSIGTEDVLRAGWTADAAIVNEPTDLHIVHAHKGFVWLEVDIFGVAAHGSRADLGVDAIANAGYFLVELDRHAEDLRHTNPDSLVGPPTIHASMIKGGEGSSSYPALCSITIERRTLAGEDAKSVETEMRTILETLHGRVLDFKYDLRTAFERPSYQLPRDHPFCGLVENVVSRSRSQSPQFEGVPYWTDAALLAEKGIAILLWGPTGEGLHAKEEWADVQSFRTVAEALKNIAAEFCR
ncbi:hypothetical protein CLAFUW4_13470 [Fulvia fulva]|uniref:Peptidase M20 dimerisation domain-containing protein n=1 Tax=Passalora fulva TaxID=5499 RepID=A0A9Q8UUW9_PASFU|nr:uncharacterized protein CLAFUR5_13323 [Fulvia fulva]KAK4612246.1 hypothetical protein CLAFUR4_13473 [Fulvia fulva]KAK4612415.1 hypothetical protein CLAFUR0_13481 [Fulvia fulva]UJO23396.1 hypothetical protein CLAFUR5_13323 [Fulvia fulva]WPV21262.1 hypothetical protein CLAFUW4_13470 [Fulvia fulva]WPV36208.1 hypothetical protein CLAFUW7_13477 [Fulvia fulva]